MIDLLLWTFASLAVHTATVQFDGAFRFPSDPGISTTSLRPLAACSACIIVQEESSSTGDNNNQRKRVKIGGKRLPVTSDLTSGVVEYEGLLLGLKGLANEYPSKKLPLRSSFVTVQGDCKTVLEQMSSLARPRKLSFYHDQSKQFLSEKLPDCTIQFEHFPRNQNILCDQISAIIIESQQQMDICEAQRELENLMNHFQINPHDDPSCLGGDVGSERMFSHFLSRHFSSQKSTIPYSIRPKFYRYLAKLAFSSKHYNVLLQVGEWFQRDVMKICPMSRKSTSSVSNNQFRDLLNVEAITYQILAFDCLERKKDSLLIQRKNRFLLRTYEAEFSNIRNELFSCSLPSGLAPLQFDTCSSPTKVWPVLVQQWYDNAIQSQSWVQDGVFWSNWMDFD